MRWVSALMSLFMLMIPAAIAVAWVVGRGMIATSPRADLDQHAQVALQAARRRMIGAATVALVLAIVLLLVAIAIGPGWIALVPGLAVGGGLLVYATWPGRDGSVGPQRAASLEPRAPRDSVTRRSIVWWGTAAVISIAAALGVLFVEFEDGVHGRAPDLRHVPGFVGTSPGWHLTLPLVGVTCVLAAVTWFALRRVTEIPALPGIGLAEQDRRWRSESAEIIVQLSAGALLVQCAATVAVVVYAVFGERMHAAPGGSDFLFLYAMVVLVIAVVAFIVFGSALSRAAGLPRHAMAVPEREPAQ